MESCRDGRTRFDKSKTFIRASDFLGDGLIDLMFEAAGDCADGIGNSFFTSGAVAFEDSAVEAEHGSAAVGVGVHTAFDRAESAASQQGTQLAMRAGGEFAFEHQEEANRQALA